MKGLTFSREREREKGGGAGTCWDWLLRWGLRLLSARLSTVTWMLDGARGLGLMGQLRPPHSRSPVAKNIHRAIPRQTTLRWLSNAMMRLKEDSRKCRPPAVISTVLVPPQPTLTNPEGTVDFLKSSVGPRSRCKKYGLASIYGYLHKHVQTYLKNMLLSRTCIKYS